MGADPADTVARRPDRRRRCGAARIAARRVVAVALSPLAPWAGPRRRSPPGIAFDWTVLGLGCAVLIVVLRAMARSSLPGRAPPGAPGAGARPARRARPWCDGGDLAACRRRPPPASASPSRPAGAATTVPVRSAILGTLLAVIVVMATLTFGTSLNTLVSHPALYGWNWDYILTPRPATATSRAGQPSLLDHDHDVAALDRRLLRVAGHRRAERARARRAARAPRCTADPVRTRPRAARPGGARQRDPAPQLHKHVGDTVTVDSGNRPATRLTIVGTATMPTVGDRARAPPRRWAPARSSTSSSSRRPITDIQQRPRTGPNVYLRPHSGRGRAEPARCARSTTIANELDAPPGNSESPSSTCSDPAEIVNYRSMGTTPAFLGGGLAAGAVVALGLTLIASVRRRRRDLALLKTLGFTRRQLAAAVAWQLECRRGHRDGGRRPARASSWAGSCGTCSPEQIYAVPRPPSRPLTIAARRSWAPWCWPTWWPPCPDGGRPGPRPPWSCGPSRPTVDSGPGQRSEYGGLAWRRSGWCWPRTTHCCARAWRSSSASRTGWSWWGRPTTCPGLLALVEEVGPDVVVTDIRMPPTGTDEGIQAAAQLRAAPSRRSASSCSASTPTPSTPWPSSDGSARRAYLLKETIAGVDELARAIRTVAEGGSVVDPAVVDALVGARHRRRPSDLDRLTAAGDETLAEMAQGKNNAAIAASLFLSERAVEKHTNAIFSKLGLTEEEDVNRRVKAVLIYLGSRARRREPGELTPTRVGASSLSGAHRPWDNCRRWTSLPVLVVDDQAPFRIGGQGRGAAGWTGFDVVGEATNGEEAVAMAAELRPGPRPHGHQHAGHERGGGHPPDRGRRARHRGHPLLHLRPPGPPARRLHQRRPGLRQQGGVRPLRAHRASGPNGRPSSSCPPDWASGLDPRG